jgi:hypothetical protein
MAFVPLSSNFTRRSLKSIASGLLAAGLGLPLLAHADPLVRFDGGIGETPAGFVAATGALRINQVNGVNPGGVPWVIDRLRADVSTDGRISVDGRGLLLAGGNGVGTNGGQSVRARLFCQGVSAGDSELVPLDAGGDFRIGGMLNQTPPNPCTTPVLLIVNAGGAWFAAGIPKP